jgi:hypothetical protein
MREKRENNPNSTGDRLYSIIPPVQRVGQRGISLVAVLVGGALLSAAVFVILRGFQQFSTGKLGLARRLKGDEALVTAAFGVQQLSFAEILAQCRARNILNTAAPRASVCVTAAGIFNPALGTPAGSVEPWTMEVLRNGLGQPSPTGNQCEEMLWCRHLASGRILEITVQGSWLDPKNTGGVIQRRLAFRRTRW